MNACQRLFTFNTIIFVWKIALYAKILKCRMDFNLSFHCLIFILCSSPCCAHSHHIASRKKPQPPNPCSYNVRTISLNYDDPDLSAYLFIQMQTHNNVLFMFGQQTPDLYIIQIINIHEDHFCVATSMLIAIWAQQRHCQCRQ